MDIELEPVGIYSNTLIPAMLKSIGAPKTQTDDNLAQNEVVRYFIEEPEDYHGLRTNIHVYLNYPVIVMDDEKRDAK